VTVQLVEVKLALDTLKVPLLLAVPTRVPFTVMDAPPRAPLPCTERVVPTSDADETLIVEEPPPLRLGGPDASRVAVGEVSPVQARANNSKYAGRWRGMFNLLMEGLCE
jgi:hypothetical protein